MWKCNHIKISMWLSQSCCIKSHFPVSLFVTFVFFLLFVPCLWGLFVDLSALAIFVVMVLYVFIIGKMQDGNMESNQIKGNQIICFTLSPPTSLSFLFISLLRPLHFMVHTLGRELVESPKMLLCCVLFLGHFCFW